MATKPKPKYFNVRIPITGAKGFKATEILYYTDVPVKGKKYNMFLIPVDGIVLMKAKPQTEYEYE